MVRHKNDYGYWEEVDRLPVPGCACGKCSRAADREVERQSRRSQRRRGSGSTMYDRRARTGSEPTGASGEVNLPTGEGHGTQYYDDGYRLSRDTDGKGDSRVHWTNDNVPKGKRHYGERHTPPEDAREDRGRGSKLPRPHPT